MALIEKLTNIANAIRNKTGKTDNLTLPQMVEEINTLSNTSNDTVTSSDMPTDITAHDSSGNQITGTLTNHKAYNNTDYSIDSYVVNQTNLPAPQFSITQKEKDPDGTLRGSAPELKFTFKEDGIYRKESSISYTFPETLIGNATAADVVKGKTFSSVDGFQKTGTYVDNSLLCDATASDILEGKTACVNEELIEGTIVSKNTIVIKATPYEEFLTTHPNVFEQGTVYFRQYEETDIWDVPIYDMYVFGIAMNQDVYLKQGSKIIIEIPDHYFGTATSSDVKAGKTFISENGFLIEGTLDFSDTTASASDLLSGKTAYSSSGKITGSMTDREAVTGDISTKTGSYTIPEGYHNGSGTVSISATEQNKIIASNIKSGVTILGVTGTYTGSSTSSGVEYCEFSATNPTVTFSKTTGTLKVYGYAKGASSGWIQTAYAFNGTSYTTVVSYGTGTTTQMTLGLSNGQITGLPTMTSGTLVAILE